MRTYWDISDAWYNTVQDCLKFGRRYTIQRGSYVGQERAQLDHLAFRISYPWTRPLGITYKGMAISDDASIEKYYQDYLISTLLNPDLKSNEQYTYAERIGPHLMDVVRMLSTTPNTNQACLNVGELEDWRLEDPPCLRVLSWKVLDDDRLQLSSFWRSWCCFSGLPTNLGGLQLLNEMMVELVGIAPGPLVCYSDGAHLYDHNWKMLQLPEAASNETREFWRENAPQWIEDLPETEL